MKVFDAIEGVEGVKPRLILVSALDIRDPEKIPAHYVSILIPSTKLGLILVFLFLILRTKTISYSLPEYEKSFQYIYIGSTKQTRIFPNVQHSNGLSYVLEDYQIILVRARLVLVEHIWEE